MGEYLLMCAFIMRSSPIYSYTQGVVHEVPNEVLDEMLPETVMLNWTATAENQAMVRSA